MINIEEAKKKYFMPSDLKIAITSVYEIKEMIITIETLQQQLEEANKRLEEAKKTIRDLKNHKRVQKCYELEKQNLELTLKVKELEA